ncbi:hypothetical protein KBD81_01105 [Candidatus Woesebacteria bacterium]|nr:hypothetical protein [Candidatus Woesebacteria bacterium]
MFKNVIGRFCSTKKIVIEKTAKPRKKVAAFVLARPFASLFVLLGLLVLLIVLGNLINRPKTTEESVVVPEKQVEVYHIGEAPTMTVQAQIEKSGVITITALSPGVVQRIDAEPGDYVAKGKTLLSMSTNYQGGNAAYLQVQLAQKQVQNIDETFDAQKEIIAKQKDIANKTDANNDEVRDISSKSIDETKSLISQNEEILSLLDDQLQSYAATESASILATKQTMSSYQSALNSLRSSLRNTEYSTSANKPQAELSNIQREISVKNLELQEKALDLNRDIARLQLRIAQVQAASMYPSSPFNATVQRVLVKVGEAVNPGTPLVILSQEIEEDPIVAIAYVPREIALKTSYAAPSELYLGNFKYESYPSYVSRDAVQGNLYGIYYPIPDAHHQKVTNNGYINVKIPIGYADTSASIPFIPIDSVYQTQDSAYVFVITDGKALARKLTLATVTGRYVEVTEGLQEGDVIILDRTVVGGDKVIARE